MNCIPKKFPVILSLLALSHTSAIFAAESEPSPLVKMDYSLSVGLNIGGTTPFPLPSNITEIKSFSPFFFPSATYSVVWNSDLQSFSLFSGVSSSLALLNKGMKSTAQVKEYKMNFENFHGKFNGTVDTEMDAVYLRIALGKYFFLSKDISLYLGFYNDVLFAGTFSGSVYDGYINDGSSKKYITREYYDFSEWLTVRDVGLSAGIKSAPFYERFFFIFELNYGFFSAFDDGFSGIDYKMQNIYFNLSIGYNFAQKRYRLN